MNCKLLYISGKIDALNSVFKVFDAKFDGY